MSSHACRIIPPNTSTNSCPGTGGGHRINAPLPDRLSPSVNSSVRGLHRTRTVLLHQVMRDDTKKAHPFSGQALRGLKADATHPWRHENLRRLLLTSVINWQDVLV